MIINHNMSAMYANRSLGVKGGEVEKNIEKLSSGMKLTGLVTIIRACSI